MIAQFGGTERALRSLGIETLAVVATAPENARVYFKFRPTTIRLASDPNLTTHHAYGVPKPEATPDLMKELGKVRINPNGVFSEPLPIMEAARVLGERDGYAGTPTDEADMKRQFPQLKAQFLVDHNSIVRWANIECANEGLAGMGKFPSTEEVLAAARPLAAA
jgi:hypothetical protein